MFHALPHIKGIEKPTELPYPHYYFPHEMAKIASEDLLEKIPILFPDNSFGFKDDGSVGKMFGVLIVENKEGELGYLRAFSGRLENTTKMETFVPPIFDILEHDGHFRRHEAEISALNEEIALLEQNEELIDLKKRVKAIERKGQQEILLVVDENKRAKAQRKSKRDAAFLLTDEVERNAIFRKLSMESQAKHFLLQDLKKKVKAEAAEVQKLIDEKSITIKELKTKRSHLSKTLQEWIFLQYKLVNSKGEETDLIKLFKDTALKYPISGAGDCAAPRLIQHAIHQGYKIITLAEFWYGASPNGVIRKHKKYYPACKGKCGPILNFLLDGFKVEENPLTKICSADFTLNILYESDDLVAVNKPYGILSVPGKHIEHSMASVLGKKYGEIFTIHRLDMGTSGILLFAKNMRAYKSVQQLFIKREVTKIYEALLDESPKEKEGIINLPLSPSYVNRPMQTYDLNGKEAITKYEVIGQKDGRTAVRFTPLTGRTHQLRVHAAHHKGLNASIVGDILYGIPSDRLYLHAAYLSFVHPITKEQIDISCPSHFF